MNTMYNTIYITCTSLLSYTGVALVDLGLRNALEKQYKSNSNLRSSYTYRIKAYDFTNVHTYHWLNLYAYSIPRCDMPILEGQQKRAKIFPVVTRPSIYTDNYVTI